MGKEKPVRWHRFFAISVIWAQPGRRDRTPMQFVPVVFVAIAFLLGALQFFDSADLLMVCAICVPSLGWLRLIFILRLKTSDRTRTAWATVRQAETRHVAGLNPNSHLLCKMQSPETWSQKADYIVGNLTADYPAVTPLRFQKM
jgi:hypothetical protein